MPALGNQVRVTASFSAAGVATDPTTVTFSVKREGVSATETAYTYGTDPEVEKLAVGEYQATITPDAEGLWRYRWTGEGAAVGATEGTFRVWSDYLP